MPKKSCKTLGILFAVSLLLVTCYPALAAAAPQYIVNGVIADSRGAAPDDDNKQIDAYSPDYNEFTDYANGYSLRYPSRMNVDVSLAAVRTVLYDDRTRIEIYYDNFSGTLTDANDYIYYGNKFVVSSPEHTITADRWFDAGGRRAHLLEWTRRKLARIPGDKNHYACAEVVKNNNEIYTVFIKSSDPISGAADLVAGLSLFEPRGTARNHRNFAASATRMNSETQGFCRKYFAPDSPLSWGIFEPSAPQNMTALTELEKKVGYSFPILLHYQMFGEYFPAMGLQQAYENKKYVELTLQTVRAGEANALWSGPSGNETVVYDILDGKYDDYFADYASRLKEFGHPVIFRLNNEMNGDWCWYSAFYTGKDAELYQAMWRYIHAIFQREGVENVVWVWNPHDLSRPAFKWNHYLMYYPGDEYVDIIGLTGYNTGNYFPGERWREFDEIYPPLVSEYAAAFNKPLMITEFASNSVGGDKVAWVQRMFDQVRRLDGIKVAVWWSGVDYDQQGRPGRIYLLDENEAVIDAFHQRLKDSRQ
ncbi:MAG: glycosyl hydrolase [Negativicutes bacterium]|nr:glycosyl hydrolase [Negativicutes bacterium]